MATLSNFGFVTTSGVAVGVKVGTGVGVEVGVEVAAAVAVAVAGTGEVAAFAVSLKPAGF